MDKQELAYLEQVQGFIDSEIERLIRLKGDQLDEARAEGEKFSLDNPYGAVYGHAFELQESIGKKMETVNRCISDREMLEKMRKKKKHSYPKKARSKPDIKPLSARFKIIK